MEPLDSPALVLSFLTETSLGAVPASPDPSGFWPLPAQWERGSQLLLPTPPLAAASHKSGRGVGRGREVVSAPLGSPFRSYSPPSPQVSVVEVSVPPLGFLQQPLPGFCHRPLARCGRMGGSQRLLLAPPNLESHSPPSPLVSCCPATFLEGAGRLLCGPLQSSLQTKAHPHLQGGVLRACQMGAVRAISSWLAPYTRMSVLQAPNPPGCLLPSLVSLAFRRGEAGRFFPSAGSQHCRCWRLAGDSAQRLLTVPPSLSPPCPRSDAPSPMR